jgi:hypothetical protein
MRYIKFHQDSAIRLEATKSTNTTPAKAINEAIDFVQIQGLESVDLIYSGFTMMITPDTDLKEKLSEYMEWEWLYSNKVKN